MPDLIALRAKRQIVVILDGGIVQDALIPEDLDVEIVVHDYDIDGAEEEDLHSDGKGYQYYEYVP